MANANSTAEKMRIEPAAKMQAEESPLFQAFSWHVDHQSPCHTLQTNSKDIGYGIATILEILEMDMLDKINGIRPLLNPTDSGNLIRMAITAAKLLADSAAEQIDLQNDRAMKRSGHV